MAFDFWSSFFSKQNISSPEDSASDKTNRIASDYSDGAIQIENAVDAFVLPLDAQFNTQAEMINNYREIACYHEVDYAIEDIVNEMVSFMDDEDPIRLNLDAIDETIISKAIKEKIYSKWEKIVRLLELDSTIHMRARQFYIDGRLAWHKIVNKDKPKDGLVGVIDLDSRYVTKVRNVQYDKQDQTIIGVDEYYVYDENVLANTKTKAQTQINTVRKQPMKLNKDSITFVTSGLTDSESGYAVSWLHKAIRPANQLRMMENALVIFRIVRAPERRVFYIDTGGLPKSKAEQYIKNLKNSYRNRMSYDPEKGTFKDQRHLMTMQEDFWLPRNSAGRGTEVSSVAGTQNLSDIDDVLFFLKRLYKALNVPLSRLESDSVINFGSQTEISRDELKFSKFVNKIRKRFNLALLDLLKTELVMSKILTDKEWSLIEKDIILDYAQDLYLEEQKQNDIMQARLDLAEKMLPYVGKYWSNDFMRTRILKQTEEEMKDQDLIIDKESKDPKYKQDEEDQNQQFQ